ncbi:hypothetical protein HYX01_04085 [Candidatus Woesearchaeota archaeon]|nr:hypothetical protein [Candidatus Woesearchaeota archaeon]
MGSYANAAAQTTQQPVGIYDIALNLISQEPDPAEPGKYVDVRFKFDNNGTGEAIDVEAEILPQYPLFLDESTSAIKKLGTLQSTQKGDVGVIAKYKLRVDKNAVEGKNELKIRYRINKGVWITPKEFFIDIQTHDAILSVDSVSIDKKAFEQGSSSIVKIKITNNADSLLKDITAKIELGNMPFIPIGSTNEKSIYQINAKESSNIDFELLANPESKSGVYQAPLKISYSDELGKGYFKNSTIGLIIGSKPDLSIALESSEIFQSDKAGEVVIKIVNKGVTDIKFVNVKLMPSNNYLILSSNDAYLGNIDSDDFENAAFKVFVKKHNKKEVKLPILIEYKDANNNDYKENKEIILSLYTSSEAKKFGFKKGNGYLGILIIIIIVAFGLLYYKRYVKPKLHRSKER